MPSERARKALALLNDEQREAVEHTDGPLLVVAGPGTGKTQLLSLRAAQILATRDAAPENILCLTFSDAGAEAMRKRLVSLIGRDAYGIEVSTFHAFAQKLRSRHPEHFDRLASDALITDLQKHQLVNCLLCRLPPSSRLFSNPIDGKSAFLSDMLSFIGTFKKSGLTTEEYRAMLKQDLTFFDAAEEDVDFMAVVNAAIPQRGTLKEAYCERFRAEVLRACDEAAADCRKRLVPTPGQYVPYAQWLRDLVKDAEIIDDEGKTAGLRTIRSSLFEGRSGERRFKDRTVCLRALDACDIYDSYQRHLSENGLYDYDDMVLDAICALERSPELLQSVRDRFTYVQVDEFQDTNGSQMRILELLAGNEERPNLMTVCDDDQAIMRFQGATIACITQFSERWRPKTVVLKTNYRSTPAIVDLGARVAAQIENRLPSSARDKDIRAHRPQDGPATFTEHVAPSRDFELHAVASNIREAIDAGLIERSAKPDEAIAVIASKHEVLRALLPHLSSLGVPYAYRETANVLTSETMQTLLAELRYVAYRSQGRAEQAMSQLPAIVASRELALSPAACLSVAKRARADYYGDWERAVVSSENKRLERMASMLRELAAKAAGLSVAEVVSRTVEPLAHFYAEAETWARAEFQAGIRALIRFAEDESNGSLRPRRALRIADVVDRLDQADAFGISVNATYEFGCEGAVRLMSAHGSKGLEFDRVYVLDADDATWHRSASSTRLFPQNVFLGNSRDEDDVRRLLFVTLTRAKSELELYRAGDQTIRELEGLIETEKLEFSPEESCSAIQASWVDAYAVDQQLFSKLLAPELVPKHLSVSALNSLVDYKEGDLRGTAYQQHHLLQIPGAPNPSTAFGSIVHALMEDYVSFVVKGGMPAEEVISRARENVLHMDVSEDEKDSYAARFDRIVELFLPSLGSLLSGRLATEVELNAVTDDGVPLFGICDLLMINDAAKTVSIVDYKTGFSYPGKTPTAAYERQLQFYKLLIESSSEFAGYSVREAVDLYVEPERGTASTLHAPARSVPNTENLEHLTRLIAAAWERMKTGDFDMTGFEDSEERAQAEEQANRNTRKRFIQRAFEDWLIGQAETKEG